MRQSTHQHSGRDAADGISPIPAFVTLAADQLETALAEVTTALGELTGIVLTLARHAKAAPEGDQAAQEALVRLQSVDRLQQRVGNVEHNLRALASLVGSSGPQPSATDWQAFLGAARERYTSETERAEFDALSTGAPDHER